ncbi:hypothetical protein [Sphingomonas hankookensis]
MTMHHRSGEVLSDDRRYRLVIFHRPDHRFVIVEERILSYERGEAENPDVIPARSRMLCLPPECR